MPFFPEDTEYSEKYMDDVYEYRHVTLCKRLFEKLPQGRLLSEDEWRHLGVQMSSGWEHYMIYKPEPFVLLFRRSLAPPPLMSRVTH